MKKLIEYQFMPEFSPENKRTVEKAWQKKHGYVVSMTETVCSLHGTKAAHRCGNGYNRNEIL